MLKQHGFDQYPLTTKSLFWFPSDGGYFPDGCETIIKKVDYPIAMSQFGQAQLTNHYGIKNIRHIPHGCKTTVFKPLDKLKLRQQYSWERLFAVKENTFYNVNMNITDKFIIGFVGRNQPRKNPAGLIKAFSIFHKDKPDAYLLMHTDPFDPARMCDLQKLAEELNCGHKILWTGMRVGQPFSTSKLVEIYNLMDCFALYTSGEGFGIPVIEAMSCEIPVLMTDATTCKELVTDNNAGYGVKLAGESRRPYPYEGAAFTGTITGSWGVERAHEDYVDGASKFEMLYTSWKRQDGLLEKLGKAGRKAVLEKYDWDSVVGPAWVKLMEEIKG